MNDAGEFVVAIPARFGSQRLPGKPLSPIGGEPMVLYVARRALAAGAREVVVATDDERIVAALQGSGVRAVMTRADHASGSDRLAECARLCEWSDETVVVNLQGDEPLAPASGIRAVASALTQSGASMATLATPLSSAEEFLNPNCVKVVVGQDGQALYFSRAPIPWPRDSLANSMSTTLPDGPPFLRHIGIYAYRAKFLHTFSMLEPTPLEKTESLEQLRALEHGYAIAVRIAPETFPPGVDTPEDLVRVQAAVSARS
jgi:3-deoxy-manno-octulosonate cytidylyltransferase (CMP-KDO synthetase)